MKYLAFLFLGFVNTALAQLSNHQIIQQFEILLYTKGEKPAFSFLSKQGKVNFPKEKTENATKLLKNLPKNIILFTKNQEENDVLLFLQARKSMRRDVKIINSILADSAKYCHFISGKVFDASRQYLSLNKAFYDENPRIVFKHENGYYENWTWKDWITYITNPLLTIRISDFSKVTNAKSLCIQKRNKNIVINVDTTDISRSFIFFLDCLANVNEVSKVYMTKDFYNIHKGKFDKKILISNELVCRF